MRVLLIANYLPDAQESMQRYAGWLAHTLRVAGHDVAVLRPQALLQRLAPRSARLAKWLGYIDKFILFPVSLRRQAKVVDVVHICDHGNAMYVHHLRGVPHLVTCHDLLAIRAAAGIEGPSIAASGRLFQRLIRRGLAQASHIVCDSATTQRDLLDSVPNLISSPEVVELPLNWPYSPLKPEQALQRIHHHLPTLKARFILHVGGNQWYKNRAGVVRIFAAMKRLGPTFSDLQLVMVGKPFDESVNQALTPDLRPQVLSVVGADNEFLQALYSMTEALLFPSRAEGFGWPIIEAQACGALVVTSNRPPMNEIAGGGAILIDPIDPEKAAQTISEAWPQRESIRAAGRRNLERFSPQRALDGYLLAYERACTTHTAQTSKHNSR